MRPRSRDLEGCPLVELDDVHMRFGKTEVHKGISFSVGCGEVVTVLGPSGTGKTVLLKMMTGLLFPTSGRVRVGGEDLAALDDEGLRRVRTRVGMLFQGAALFDSLTVAENIAFPLREFGGYDEDAITKIVTDSLSLVGLPGIETKTPPALSGGQRKRIGLARALATSPQVVLFDEPTTGLDPTARARIDEVIKDLRDGHGITSVVVTHDMESARQVSDRLVLLDKGRVVADGQAAELWEGNDLVRRFASGRWT